jgi:geranylgeranyl pyrophosphate synthase
MVETAGKKLGQSMQISQDIAGIWQNDSDKLPGETILNKRKTLPVAFSMDKATIKEKREIGTIYYKRVLESQDVEKLIVILNKLGAKEYSQKVSSELENEALALFDRAGVSKSGVKNIRILVNDYFSNNY